MIEFVSQVSSTNGELAARLRSGDFVPEGHWLVADRQNAGRGRQGRAWDDGPGNFMGSTVVRPRAGDPPAPTLALLAGLAVQQVIAPHAVSLLKWPNDVLIGEAKVAGILLEAERDAVIVGIGVNLAVAPDVPGRGAAALSGVNRDDFARDLERVFDQELERWRTVGLEPLLRRWQAVAHPVGTALTVDDPGDGRIAGEFAGLAEDGALQLRLASGEVRAIHAGEVRL